MTVNGGSRREGQLSFPRLSPTLRYNTAFPCLVSVKENPGKWLTVSLCTAHMQFFSSLQTSVFAVTADRVCTMFGFIKGHVFTVAVMFFFPFEPLQCALLPTGPDTVRLCFRLKFTQLMGCYSPPVWPNFHFRNLRPEIVRQYFLLWPKMKVIDVLTDFSPLYICHVFLLFISLFFLFFTLHFLCLFLPPSLPRSASSVSRLI